MIKAQRVFPEVDITIEMLEEAKIIADKIPDNLNNSIRHGDGRLAGAVGEVAFAKYINGISKNTYQHDVVLSNGIQCEVKTKEREKMPLSKYEASVSDANYTQKCDYYVFTSTLHDYSKVWIVGYLSPQEYKKIAWKRLKGELDLSNNQVCKANCWNTYIYQLDDIKNLNDEQKKKKEHSKKISSKKNNKI